MSSLSQIFSRHSVRLMPFFVVAIIGASNVATAALPTGEEATVGDVEFDFTEEHLTIFQRSRRAIIEWEDFSIGEGNTVTFSQPSGAGGIAVLNRVRADSEAVSNIAGRLEANAGVFLINPNGIIVGQDSVIDTGSFVASTLDVDDDEFLRGEDLRFSGESEAQLSISGRIVATEGDIILIARRIRQEGALRAEEGTVAMAAPTDEADVLVSADLPFRIFVRPAPEEEAEDAPPPDLVAEAGQRLSTVDGNSFALAINSAGIARATGVSEENGRTLLVSDTGPPGPDRGEVVHLGDIRARNVTMDGEAGVRIHGPILAGQLLTLRSEQGDISQTDAFQSETLLLSAGGNIDLFHPDNRLSFLGMAFDRDEGVFLDDQEEDDPGSDFIVRAPVNAQDFVRIETERLVLRDRMFAGGEEDAIVIVVDEGLENRVGSGAFQTGRDGRWLVYARHPDDIIFDGLRSAGTERYGIVHRDEEGELAAPEFDGNGFLFSVSREEGRPDGVGQFDRFHREAEHARHPTEGDRRDYSRRPSQEFPSMLVDTETPGWRIDEPVLARSSSFTEERAMTDRSREEEE